MLVSKRRHADLYRAISEPIVSIRIEYAINNSHPELDNELRKAELKIHENIVKVLNLQKRQA